MNLDKAFNQPWSEKSPRTTPDGLANSQIAVATLESVAAKVEKTYGALDVPWGDVFRLKYGNVDLHANGGFGDLRIFRVVDFAPADCVGETK